MAVIPDNIIRDFNSVHPHYMKDIKTTTLRFEGVTTQTEYVFYSCKNYWHIQPLMQLCYVDWEEKMVFLERTTFTKNEILYPPACLLDSLDLGAVEFHYQGGWDKVLHEVFGVKSFPKTREEIQEASRILEIEMDAFFNELDIAYKNYQATAVNDPSDWILSHSRRMISGHIKRLRVQRHNLSSKKLRR